MNGNGNKLFREVFVALVVLVVSVIVTLAISTGSFSALRVQVESIEKRLDRQDAQIEKQEGRMDKLFGKTGWHP